MAYTIVKSDGTVLTTIADGTINTTSSSLGLPGRNYAGYGQTLDTNFVHQLENFADTDPPPNPLRGQLWYNTNNQTLYVCPTDGETNSANWSALTSTTSGGTTTFGAVTITGNLLANNAIFTNQVSANLGTFAYLTVTSNANIADANITTSNIGNLTTQVITTGANTTAGTITGTWTANGGLSGNTVILTNGNLFIGNSGGANLYGVRTDKYMYANGTPISFAGTYSNSNVAGYLPTYNGVVLASNVTTPIITTGANTTPGTITGNFTLSAGSRFNATYADLAERFEADTHYDAGTVVELGGDKEITAVKYELSEDVFGVISHTAAYLMNSGAGDDETHPPVAVSGRVKVKVTGKVSKGQRLVSAGNGIARAANPGEANSFNTIGRSLVNKTTVGIGTVEAIVIIR
jgi:Peptidase_G2, IMC autoproteolytic cleavage domain